MFRNKILVKCLFIIIISSVSSTLVYPDETAVIWINIYRKAGSFYQQYNILRQIVEQRNRAYIPFLVTELKNMVYKSNLEIKASKDNEIRKQIIGLMIRQLGDFRVKQTAHEYYKVFKEATDPFLRGEAVVALGKAGIRDYDYDIIMTLRNLNLYGKDQGLEMEVIVQGCVAALRRLHDAQGYEVVFFAAEAGYTTETTRMAERALLDMIDDPTPILQRLVKEDALYRIKLIALKRANESQSKDEGKIKVAVEALTQGVFSKGFYPKDIAYLRELRLLAMDTLIKLNARDEKAVPLTERLLRTEKDINERITGLQLLGVLGGEKAGEVLLSYLAEQNDRSAKGFEVDDKRLLITAIRSIGQIDYKKAREELLRVQYTELPHDVVKEANSALKAMGF
ncbi:MAG: hypothetical protein JW969_21435 [Spirochaetales bacterium]|nr:hypothetical protein [Spirochaetales bacterium]